MSDSTVKPTECASTNEVENKLPAAAVSEAAKKIQVILQYSKNWESRYALWARSFIEPKINKLAEDTIANLKPCKTFTNALFQSSSQSFSQKVKRSADEILDQARSEYRIELDDGAQKKLQESIKGQNFKVVKAKMKQKTMEQYFCCCRGPGAS